MLARFSRLIPMYQGIGGPCRAACGAALAHPAGPKTLFFMPRKQAAFLQSWSCRGDGLGERRGRERPCQVKDRQR